MLGIYPLNFTQMQKQTKLLNFGLYCTSQESDCT